MKRLCFEAEPTDCFNLKGDWVIMTHNLDDAGDVEQVSGISHKPEVGLSPWSGAPDLGPLT